MNNLTKALLALGGVALYKNRGNLNVRPGLQNASLENQAQFIQSILVGFKSRDGNLKLDASNPLTRMFDQEIFASPYMDGDTITGKEVADYLGISMSRLRAIAKKPDENMYEAILESITKRNLTGEQKSQLQNAKLLAQYNSIYGQALPQVTSSQGAGPASLGFSLQSSAEPLAQATSSQGAGPASLGFSLQSSPEPLAQATSSQGAGPASLGFSLQSSAEPLSKATSSQGAGPASLGFGIIPSFEEFSQNPSKYRKK